MTELPLAKTLRRAEGQRKLEKDHQNICGAPTALPTARAADADADALTAVLPGGIGPRVMASGITEINYSQPYHGEHQAP